MPGLESSSYRNPWSVSAKELSTPPLISEGLLPFKAATKLYLFTLPSFSVHRLQHLPQTKRWEKGRDLSPSPEMCDVSLHPGKCSSIHSALRWVQQGRFMAEAFDMLGL